MAAFERKNFEEPLRLFTISDLLATGPRIERNKTVANVEIFTHPAQLITWSGLDSIRGDSPSATPAYNIWPPDLVAQGGEPPTSDLFLLLGSFPVTVITLLQECRCYVTSIIRVRKDLHKNRAVVSPPSSSLSISVYRVGEPEDPLPRDVPMICIAVGPLLFIVSGPADLVTATTTYGQVASTWRNGACAVATNYCNLFIIGLRGVIIPEERAWLDHCASRVILCHSRQESSQHVRINIPWSTSKQLPITIAFSTRKELCNKALTLLYNQVPYFRIHYIWHITCNNL